MQNIDFYKLPRPDQERLVGSINGKGLPAPIVRSLSKPVTPPFWLALSGVGLVLLVIFFFLGFGRLGSGLAREGTGWLAVDVVLATVCATGVLQALASRRAHASSPFKRGVYLFPVGIIDARSSSLRVFPLEDLTSVVGPDARGVTLDFGGTSFSFPVQDAAQVNTINEQIDGARSSLKQAGAARESIRPKAIAALDPLRGYANPLASSDSIKKPGAGWTRLAWPIAFVAGVLLGAPLWLARNAASDGAMFAHATQADDAPSYRAYLQSGTRHADEVSQALLPRALLRDAQKVGTVEAVEQFIKDNPQPAVQAEAAAALGAALLVDLAAAVKEGTLAAIDDFTRRHPRAHLDADVAAARHRVYQDAYARYATAVTDKGSPALALVQGLLAWAEKHGPKVEVRYHAKVSKTLDRADREAGKSRQFKGAASFPSHYFDDAAQKSNLDAVEAAVAGGFAAFFPPEVLTVVPAAPLTDTDLPASVPITAPTLVLDHTTTWSGSLQTSGKPRGVFAGLELGFEAFFRLPDTSKPVKVEQHAWYTPDLSVAQDADNPEELVYAAMRAKAYGQFQDRLLKAMALAAK
jgi:hypothetical protein